MYTKETRKCRVCGQTKPISDFNKNGFYYRTDCKECKKKYTHLQYVKKKDQISKRHKKYYREHAEQYRQWRSENKDYLKEANKEWYIKNKDRVKKYREDNKEHIIKVAKEYRAKNKDHLKKIRSEYYIKNPHYHRDYDRRRTANDYLYKFKKQIRNNIRLSFYRKRYDKNNKTKEIVGCDIETLVNHLINTYKKRYGVSWNTKDTVHIDHIIPLATAKNKEDIIKLCHYTNLQLLTPKDNMEKKDKLEWVLGE